MSRNVFFDILYFSIKWNGLFQAIIHKRRISIATTIESLLINTYHNTKILYDSNYYYTLVSSMPRGSEYIHLKWMDVQAHYRMYSSHGVDAKKYTKSEVTRCSNQIKKLARKHKSQRVSIACVMVLDELTNMKAMLIGETC